MGTVQQLTQIGFTPNQAKHLGMNGLDISYGGWIPTTIVSDNNVIDVSQSAVYASASTFTVPGDITPYIQKGDKFRLTQPTLGTKYGYILSASYGAPNTTITIAVNTDYTIANEAITNFWVSRLSLPYGFPTRFNWTPTLTGFSADPTNTVYQYYIQNKTCIVDVRQATQGTSNTTGFTITVPITATTVTNAVWGIVCWQAFNNSNELSPPARAFVSSAGTTIQLQSSTASGVWTAANGKSASFTGLSYPI